MQIQWFWGGDFRVYIMELLCRLALRSYHDISPHNCHRGFPPKHVPEKFMKNGETKNFWDPRNQHSISRQGCNEKNADYLNRGYIQSMSDMEAKKGFWKFSPLLRAREICE